MSKVKPFNIEVGSGIIGIFQRMETTILQIFSEFIDNSLQSYIDHEDVLKKIGVNYCEINIEWSNDQFSITDNSFGMDEEAFSRAIRLNAPAKQYSKGSLGQYGIGLKYAAASMGEKYSISTTSYGEKNEYCVEIDLDYLKKYNPKELQVDIFERDIKEHYTKITIKNLNKKYTYNEQEKIVKNLGKIYESYLSSKQLKIILNNINVEFNEPEFRKNKNGNDYIEFFDNSFNFDNKKYEYNGYIAILKKGNQDETGFLIKLNDRVLELSYKPQSLLGKGNDYRQQRIYGVINLSGDTWVPRFDKDGIVWKDTGLEERFLESLKSLACVNEILNTAKKLRREDNPYCKVETNVKNGRIIGIKKSYETGEDVIFSVYANEGYKIKQVKVNDEILINEEGQPNCFKFTANKEINKVNAIFIEDKNYMHKNSTDDINDQSNVNDSKLELDKTVNKKQNNITNTQAITSNLTLEQRIEKRFSYLKEIDFIDDGKNSEIYEGGIIINFRNTKYSFIINDINDPKIKDFISIGTKEPYKNSYIINLNYNFKPFEQINIDSKIKEIFYIHAILFTLGRFLGENNGCKLNDSEILLNAINEVCRGK